MKPSRHHVTMVLAVLYLAVLAAIVFWPSPVDRPIDGDLREFLRWLRSQSIPQWISTYASVEFTANIVLFVPFGIIAAVRVARPYWWTAFLAGAALSGFIELTQELFLPERLADWRDIVANTSGALVGALCVVLWRALHPKPVLVPPPHELG